MTPRNDFPGNVVLASKIEGQNETPVRGIRSPWGFLVLAVSRNPKTVNCTFLSPILRVVRSMRRWCWPPQIASDSRGSTARCPDVAGPQALLSAIVDDCDVVVAQLLEAGACSPHGENEAGAPPNGFHPRLNVSRWCALQLGFCFGESIS